MNNIVNTYVALSAAIVLEVAGTTFLQLSEQLTRLVPTSVMGLCYIASFYFLSLALRAIPIGLAYAIWSGLGIVLISIIGYVKFRQALDTPALVGVGLIVAGVAIVNVFSKSIVHLSRRCAWPPLRREQVAGAVTLDGARVGGYAGERNGPGGRAYVPPHPIPSRDRALFGSAVPAQEKSSDRRSSFVPLVATLRSRPPSQRQRALPRRDGPYRMLPQSACSGAKIAIAPTARPARMKSLMKALLEIEAA